MSKPRPKPRPWQTTRPAALSETYVVDVARLDAWSAAQPVSCESCGKHLDTTDQDACLAHFLVHEQNPLRRAQIEHVRWIWRNWENLPAHVKQQFLAPVIARACSDQAKLEALLREGVVTRIASEGPVN